MQALSSMKHLIVRYMDDAMQQQNLDQFMACRAPFWCYAEYLLARYEKIVHDNVVSILNRSVEPFSVEADAPRGTAPLLRFRI